jgi:uridine kinase
MAKLAAFVCLLKREHPTRVAVDGTTASGKSTIARELTEAVEAVGRPAIHLTMDGYHHPRAHRYRKGKLSAEGYYEDAYDFNAFVQKALLPLGPDGDRRFRTRIIDLPSNESVDEPPEVAPDDSVLIVDGSFLQRPEIADHWDCCIFVNTGFDISLARGVARDAAALGGKANALFAYQSRYHAAARLYIDAVHPADRATVVVDNDDLDHPKLRFSAGPSTDPGIIRIPADTRLPPCP